MDYLRKSQFPYKKLVFSTLGTLSINGLLKEISISLRKALLLHYGDSLNQWITYISLYISLSLSPSLYICIHISIYLYTGGAKAATLAQYAKSA